MKKSRNLLLGVMHGVADMEGLITPTPALARQLLGFPLQTDVSSDVNITFIALLYLKK